MLGTNVTSLFHDVAEDAAPPIAAELVDTLDQLGPRLVALLSDTKRSVKALRVAAPYSTPANVQTQFRHELSRRLLAGTIEVQRIEIFYSLDRLQEILSNIIRYRDCGYWVKSFCAGLTEVAPALGGYYFDDEQFLLGAYWTAIPPHGRPGLLMSGEPFRVFFREYWGEIWRRGTLLNHRKAHDLSAIRDIALKLGLPPSDWLGFVQKAQDLEIGDGAPPLV